MRTFFLGVLVFLKVLIYTFGKDVQILEGDIRNFAVGLDKVFVVTDSHLLQMNHDLSEDKYMVISNGTHPNNVNILLPFHANNTLIICGTSQCGYCEVLDINDITKSIYREILSIPPFVNESSVAFLLDYDDDPSAGNGTFLLVGRENEERARKSNKNQKVCQDFHSGVTIWNTLQSQQGDIFSKMATDDADPHIEVKKDVEWVNGFQASSHSFLFANINSASEQKVVLLRMKNSVKKGEMVRSLKGTTLQCCDDKPRRKLLSSAVISSGSPLVFTGIFSAQNSNDPENTALAIFKIDQFTQGVPSGFSCAPVCTAKSTDHIITSYSVVFKHSSITSVAAVKSDLWTVLYIGTSHGQLLKLFLDKIFRSRCVTELYRSDGDKTVFPTLHLDPVDQKHIYIALRNEIRRVAVTQCDAYSTLKECITSVDPFCGLCVGTSKCCTQNECSGSAWINFQDSLQNGLTSFQVAHNSGDITLNLHLNLKSIGSPPLVCAFKLGGVNVCARSSTNFPNCSCDFSSKQLSYDGLGLTVTVSIGNPILTESLTVRDCSNIIEKSPYAQCLACISAGCYWSSGEQKCTWWTGSESHEHMQGACQTQTSIPEIISLSPDHAYVYGTDNAVMTGKNLESVIKIRFQGVMDCRALEIQVLERSSNILKFNIPRRHEGIVKMCVMTADGRCHSSTTFTYLSKPTCSGLQSRSSWGSGGRKIQVLGNNLQYVETIIMHPSNTEISVKPNAEGLMFYTPPVRAFREYGSSAFSISLKVRHLLVKCPDNLSYYPDPVFINFFTYQEFNDLCVTIKKKQDRLNIRMEDIKVWGLQGEKQYECAVERVTPAAVFCKILESHEDLMNVQLLRVSVGDFSTLLQNEEGHIQSSLFCMRPLP